MILLLFGPPGSGKGTQSRLLSQWLGIPAVSTGDLLRAEVASGSALGRILGDLLQRGEYVSDDLVNTIVVHQLESSPAGVILDGYPRTVEQADFLRDALAARNIDAPLAVHLDVPDDTIIARLGARRVCPQCRRVFNLMQQPPARDGVCDDCGSALSTRSDDTPAVVRQRLATYARVTAPIFDHFRNNIPINGNQPPEAVFSEICSRLTERVGWVSENTRLAISRSQSSP
jgi:adenylate kinase